MNILFLDDSKERTKFFLSRVPSAKTFLSASKIINELAKGEKNDIIFLDHDLGHQMFQDSNEENCGMAVVRWIVKNNPIIKNIIVHSLNFDAAMEMVNKLKNAGYKARYISFLMLMSEDNLYNIIAQCRNH